MATKYKTNIGIILEEYDEFAVNPREDDDGIFTKFYTFNHRHRSPDKCSFSSFKDWMYHILGARSAKPIDELFGNGDKAAVSELVKVMYKKGYVMLPVYKYEHGGIVYRAAESNPFSCSFDSCLCGIIYCSKNDIHKTYGRKCCKDIINKVYDMMRAEVDLYSKWADGEVYQYCLEGTDEWIGGFYGDISENGAEDEFGFSEYEIIH